MIRTVLASLCGLLALGSGALAFDGRYQRSGPEFRQTAEIRNTGGGIYSVKLTVQSRLCTGELDATGEVKGGSLIAEVNAQDDDCKVTITRRGSAIAVRESKCLNWHGAACDFNGTLPPR